MIRNSIKITLIGLLLIFVYAPAVIAAPPDQEMCSFLEQFHGHTCAGSLMGLRLSLAAKEALGDHGKLKAKCFLLACPVDGVQVGAKTTYGNKALEVEDKNELCLVLTDVPSGRQVEARLTEKAVEMGKRFRELSGKARSYKSGSPEQMSARKEVDAVLDWFRTTPDADVVTVLSLK